MVIVIAWTDIETRIVRARRTDLGERPEVEDVRVGRSCTWLLDGDDSELARAGRYAPGR
jgi:hypothetical protein